MKLPLLLIALLAAPLMMGAPLAHAHGEKRHAPAKETISEQTAWGIAGKPAQVNRTVTLDMTDAMRFTPDNITVQEGDTVRFVVRNKGRMLHEMVIGTPDELAKHAALMAKFPDMQHDEAYMVHVNPGKTGEIVWHFNRAGSFEFACLIAGHYEAGMRGTITVTPKLGDAK
ncbi:MAG: cupredoxin family protein [Thiobacillus sp.]|nr:cupredoxin family protein [Thiobacillus sp.]MDP2057865.1 cupredoxin family protein [Thiobacillus sp.]